MQLLIALLVGILFLPTILELLEGNVYVIFPLALITLVVLFVFRVLRWVAQTIKPSHPEPKRPPRADPWKDGGPHLRVIK